MTGWTLFGLLVGAMALGFFMASALAVAGRADERALGGSDGVPWRQTPVTLPDVRQVVLVYGRALGERTPRLGFDALVPREDGGCRWVTFDVVTHWCDVHDLRPPLDAWSEEWLTERVLPTDAS